MAETWHVSKLEVDVRYHGEIPVIEARGECDLITSRKLKETIDSLVNTGRCKIIFDLRDMTYIDSSGFRTLLDAKNKASEKGGDIALVSLTAPVERVFNLLRLGEIITCSGTVDEAAARLSSISCP
ncbi:MAG TPA: STAS domain-containing protein [Armatimonadota bacterium]